MSATLPTLLPDRRLDLASYRDQDGYGALERARPHAAALREVLASTTLTGLGGAHFPFARKLSLALAQPAPRALVCNAAEDEPGSRKDRTLLTLNPHAVLEGALLAAHAADANLLYIYVSEGLREALDSVEQALRELAEFTDALEGVDVRVVRAPTAYVAGEASAALEVIEGREGKPREQPPYPTESGVNGRSTLVNNCETLANLPRVVTALAADPTATPVLSRLVTISGDIERPGVYEILPDATTFGDLITLAGGLQVGLGPLKAIQPGGPSSAFLPVAALNTLMSDEEIKAAGSQPGCLAVRILADSRCMVEELCELTRFFVDEQCGQCPACRMKTQSYARIVQQIQKGAGQWKLLDQLAAVDEFVADMPRRCALISMPSPPVYSAARLFRDDFASHIDAGMCGKTA